MTMQVKRKKDNRVVKCILHRIADIPGGVSVATANLGGKALFEGTPVGKGANGLYSVVKTAQILAAATASAKSYNVAKGHHFIVGDRFATPGANGQLIESIDKTDATKDVITLKATLGVAVEAGEIAFESAGEDKNLKVSPVAVAGSNMDVDPDGDNLWVDAWVHGVVLDSNAPGATAAIKAALKGIVYV